jgi:hypothetical protein
VSDTPLGWQATLLALGDRFGQKVAISLLCGDVPLATMAGELARLDESRFAAEVMTPEGNDPAELARIDLERDGELAGSFFLQRGEVTFDSAYERPNGALVIRLLPPLWLVVEPTGTAPVEP